MAKSQTHFVYMMRCRGNRIYTGYATDVEARYRKHCEGKAAHFTRAFPPLELLAAISVPTRSAGLKLEAALKKLPRKKKDLFLLDLKSATPH